jgi:hypothetical protein
VPPVVVVGSEWETGGQVLNGMRQEVLCVRNVIPQGNSGDLAKEKVVREGNNVLIVIRPIIVVRALGECISTIGGTSDVPKVEIILREVIDVSCDTAQDLLWVTVICEVCMVDKDLYREKCAYKEVLPMIKAEDEAHEFTIPDVVVALRLHEFT